MLGKLLSTAIKIATLPVDMVDIPGANHNFSSADWKQQVGELIDSFLARIA